MIKRLLPPDFVISSRPTEDNFAQEYSTATRTRQAVAACALLQKQWDECNCGLFDIVVDSISVTYFLTEARLTRRIRSNSRPS